MSSYNVSSRVKRAMNQKIYLLKAINLNKTWTFNVQGSSGTNYEVYFGKDKTSCSCPDCKTRNHTCKHIIFIIGRVAKDEETLKKVTMNLKSFLNTRLDKLLTKRLNSRYSKTETIEIVEDTDCIICFDEINEVKKSEQTCIICKINYHKDCINKWLILSNLCPHCKQEWKMFSEDELENFKSFIKEN